MMRDLIVTLGGLVAVDPDLGAGIGFAELVGPDLEMASLALRRREQG
jgi:hypothetical protein